MCLSDIILCRQKVLNAFWVFDFSLRNHGFSFCLFVCMGVESGEGGIAIGIFGLKYYILTENTPVYYDFISSSFQLY